MNTRFAWVLAAAVLAGCSNDWSAGLGLAEDGRQQAAATAPGVASISPVNGVRPIGFASAPDRGDLLQYPAAPVVRRTGAYTWHATRLSEEHAMAAVVSGRMRITAPDGTPIALDYARHVEHPDGNWSWIGRNPDAPGQDAVITFGPEAVFGSVPQGNDLPPLRLTMADGAGWVVSADPRQLADIRNSATHPDGPDYLVPPKLTSASGTSSGMAMAGAQPQAATASATTTVDVLVGYTNGFASERGGSSAAVTRVHNLVDITNQAYANSQVDAQLRLVHSMQVTYPDATDNGTALEELTGFKAPSTPTTPAPAFNGLRAARDQYGADLVVLVRQFNEPENGGCGIAWLIGGGRSGISQSDEFFGYSVVSDGREVENGSEYFCREETFAHEIGHNMGSQHDKATAGDSYGAFDYSFGHKTSSSAGNFYTVMAYGDSGQAPYLVFSNPSINTCGGRACGIANQADNARSLRQTIPTIAGFRATSLPRVGRLRDDVDGDGKSDLIWFRPSDGRLSYWIMNGHSVTRRGEMVVGGGWRVEAQGDFNGDGRMDLIWNRSRGDMQYWAGDGAGFASRQFLAYFPVGWSLLGTPDVDGDGKSDLLWFRASDGRLAYWIMNGPNIVRHGSVSVGTALQLQAMGDFDGDGRVDLIWNRSGGDMQYWAGDGSNFASREFLANNPRGWTVVAARDIDADGNSDLLWFRPSDGRVAYWVMDGPSILRHGDIPVGGAWRVEAVGDFNGDGRVELIWNRSSGDMQYWTGDGANFVTRQFFVNSPPGWHLLQFR